MNWNMKSKKHKEICFACNGTGFSFNSDNNIHCNDTEAITYQSIDQQLMLVKTVTVVGEACIECDGNGYVIKDTVTVCLRGVNGVN
jgi:DnaJ-class molecular chaperone